MLHGAGLHHIAYDLEGGGVDDPLRPFFCRMGSKFAFRNKILPHIPPHKKYVEPFAGVGGIFFAKPKAEQNVLNDLDKQTAANFRLLQKAPVDVEAYPDASTLEAHKRLIVGKPTGVAGRIAKQMVQTCSGFSGVPATTAKQVYRHPSIRRKAKHMEEYKEKLKGVKITSADYAKVIKANDGPNTFFFIDPPYENTDKSFGYAEDKGFDFERLANVLSHIKGKFLMTMNDSPRIRELFGKFHIKGVKADSNMKSVTTHGKTKKYERHEVFVMNYNR